MTVLATDEAIEHLLTTRRAAGAARRARARRRSRSSRASSPIRARGVGIVNPDAVGRRRPSWCRRSSPGCAATRSCHRSPSTRCSPRCPSPPSATSPTARAWCASSRSSLPGPAARDRERVRTGAARARRGGEPVLERRPARSATATARLLAVVELRLGEPGRTAQGRGAPGRDRRVGRRLPPRHPRPRAVDGHAHVEHRRDPDHVQQRHRPGRARAHPAREHRLLFPDGAERDVDLPPKNHTERIRVETRGPGTFPVVVDVTTEGGLPIQTTKLSVRSSLVSGVGVVLMVGALAFLAVWWGWDIHRRRKRRVRDDAVGATAPLPA